MAAINKKWRNTHTHTHTRKRKTEGNEKKTSDSLHRPRYRDVPPVPSSGKVKISTRASHSSPGSSPPPALPFGSVFFFAQCYPIGEQIKPPKRHVSPHRPYLRERTAQKGDTTRIPNKQKKTVRQGGNRPRNKKKKKGGEKEGLPK